MQKIISMLLIGIMLTGCGKAKDLISPSASANADLTAMKAEIEALKAKGQEGGPNANEDVAALKAKMEALEAKDTKGWWNWKVSEEGLGSWITTKTIAAAIAVAIVVPSFLYLNHKTSKTKQGLKDVKIQADKSTTDITNLQTDITNLQSKTDDTNIEVGTVKVMAVKAGTALAAHKQVRIGFAHPN